jgi:hypothetical protein
MPITKITVSTRERGAIRSWKRSLQPPKPRGPRFSKTEIRIELIGIHLNWLTKFAKKNKTTIQRAIRILIDAAMEMQYREQHPRMARKALTIIDGRVIREKAYRPRKSAEIVGPEDLEDCEDLEAQPSENSNQSTS